MFIFFFGEYIEQQICPTVTLLILTQSQPQTLKQVIFLAALFPASCLKACEIFPQNSKWPLRKALPKWLNLMEAYSNVTSNCIEELSVS